MVQEQEHSFPHDEFDVPPPEVGRVGVRRKVTPLWRSYVPLGLTVAAAVVALIMGAILYQDTRFMNSEPVAQQATPVATQTQEPQPSPTPSATVNRTQSIEILNSIGVDGLAATYSQALNGLGWSAITPKNYDGESLQETVVFYGDDALSKTAEQLQKDIGFGKVQQSLELGSGISVVLGMDTQYSPAPGSQAAGTQ